jgi:shikimate kinase
MSKQSFENQELIINSNTIFLVGFMGSGKTTLGKSLAEVLNYKFIDSDSYIEEKTKMSISSIFDLKGEDYFRSLEYEFIKRLNVDKPTVISTGGGLPCFNDLIEKMKQIGIVFYLKTSEYNILERLSLDQTRPLLKDLSESERKFFISNKLKEREIYYNKANFIIDANQSINDQIVSISYCLTGNHSV